MTTGVTLADSIAAQEARGKPGNPFWEVTGGRPWSAAGYRAAGCAYPLAGHGERLYLAGRIVAPLGNS